MYICEMLKTEGFFVDFWVLSIKVLSISVVRHSTTGKFNN